MDFWNNDNNDKPEKGSWYVPEPKGDDATGKSNSSGNGQAAGNGQTAGNGQAAGNGQTAGNGQRPGNAQAAGNAQAVGNGHTPGDGSTGSGQYPDNAGNEMPGMENGPENGDEYIKRIYIHIEPNTLLYSTSMVLSVIAVATAVMGTVYLPFIFGGIAIVMGVVSRDANGMLHQRAKIGILVGIAAIVLNIAIVSVSVYTVLTNPEQYAAFNSVFERLYGQDFKTFAETVGIPFTDKLPIS
ncbi:MAG: hypothetical protein K6G12_06165 [Lachnospiraceae bacterium]|nr:hypothetical protein [Lachnospiraceae bacterium]